MNSIFASASSWSASKFDRLSVVDEGLSLTKNKKEVTTILFSDLDKIYIKKCQISLINKIGFLSVLVLLAYFLVSLFSKEIVLLTSILFIPLVVKIFTYKSYQLCLRCYDGTLFANNFNFSNKQDYINLVSKVRKEIFDQQIKCNTHYVQPTTNNSMLEEFFYTELSIA